MMKNHLYKFDTIVIGGTNSAVAYSYNNNLPILYVKQKTPHRFELESGRSKLDSYKKALYMLSLKGAAPLSNKVSSIRIEDNILNIATTTSRLIRAQFEKAIIFDEEGLIGLEPVLRGEPHRYRILDWFDVRSGMCHEHAQLESCLLYTSPSPRD